jgi:hypothetical protein
MASAASPQRAPAVLFAPSRPIGVTPAASWKLPADALPSGGSEVARAAVSLYMQPPGGVMQLKYQESLLVLFKLKAFTYEFRVCTKEKLLISQPLLSSLTFFFKPVRDRQRHKWKGDGTRTRVLNVRS